MLKICQWLILLIMHPNTCPKCERSNLVKGTLETPSQPMGNHFINTTQTLKLKTFTCMDCGFVQLYIDKK